MLQKLWATITKHGTLQDRRKKTGRMALTRCLGFHCERLHDKHIWWWVEKIARWMADRGMKATFFVYPFRAQVSGKNITEQVRSLAAMGHEIGQHTHFYSGTMIDKPQKFNDLSVENIIHCLQRDFETLYKMGVKPKGFTAGAWIVNNTILDTLIMLGFTYDCSTRLPSPKLKLESAYQKSIKIPEIYANSKGRLLCLPTSYGLGEYFRFRRKDGIQNVLPFQIVYLHDYDLLSLRYYLLLWLFLICSKRHCFLSTGMLADQIIDRKDNHGGQRPCRQV